MLLLIAQKNIIQNNEYYVKVESIEQLENDTYQITFDGFESRSFETFSSGTIWENYREITSNLFTLKLKSNSRRLKIWKIRDFENLWLILRTTSSNSGLKATQYIDNSELFEVNEIFLHSIETLPNDSKLSEDLSNFIQWNQNLQKDIESIQSHLKSIKPKGKQIHKLNVYNVGQGSLSAVTDQNNVPFFYFDLGGAWGPNKKSYLSRLKLCFTNTRTIILSHWDLDHVETAKRIFRSTQSHDLDGIVWIAPKQNITAYYAKLAAQMSDSGTLLLWETNTPRPLDFWAGKLIKCNGSDKNDSGLALLVNSPQNDIKSVLHPGDAAYKHIPNYIQLQLDGLVATHHGAEFDDHNSPIPQSNVCRGAIVYSHGYGYGHPKINSIIAHARVGWANIKETVDRGNIKGGNISFTLSNNNTNIPCNNVLCDLATKQTF
jgi:hypothetical protein